MSQRSMISNGHLSWVGNDTFSQMLAAPSEVTFLSIVNMWKLQQGVLSFVCVVVFNCKSHRLETNSVFHILLCPNHILPTCKIKI